MKNRKTIFIILIIVLLCFGCFVSVFLFYTFLTPYKMTGSSMSPTIEDGQYIISNSLLEPETGAIIIYKDRGGQNMITRIIAEENDTVKIADGRVYVNGEGITEDYLSTEVETKEGRFIEENIEYQVPENSFFILGDNRMNSRDSREFGFVDSENIISVFWFSF